MLTKDHTVWKFDLLQELIEGPLLNPKRLEEAIKVSRFIRRLLSFFHPFGSGMKFSDLPRTKVRCAFFPAMYLLNSIQKGQPTMGEIGMFFVDYPYGQSRWCEIPLHRGSISSPDCEKLRSARSCPCFFDIISNLLLIVLLVQRPSRPRSRFFQKTGLRPSDVWISRDAWSAQQDQGGHRVRPVVPFTICLA